MTSELECAYTAGLIDGEGCIRIQKNHGLTLCVSNTSLDMLQWLRDVWGGRIYVNRHKYVNSKPFFQWQVHGKPAVAVIRQICPYMIVKIKQADKAIEFEALIGVKNNYIVGFNELKKAERQVIYQELKSLNQRGIH